MYIHYIEYIIPTNLHIRFLHNKLKKFLSTINPGEIIMKKIVKIATLQYGIDRIKKYQFKELFVWEKDTCVYKLQQG